MQTRLDFTSYDEYEQKKRSPWFVDNKYLLNVF